MLCPFDPDLPTKSDGMSKLLSLVDFYEIFTAYIKSK